MVANAKPDGYTLLMGSGSSLAIGPALYPQAGFNATQSFAPIGQVYSSPFVIMTGTKFPATTLTEFIAAVKAKPGAYNVTSPAAGGQPYMAGEMFKWVTGVDLVPVPFGNLALAGNALVIGQAHLLIAGPGTMMSHIRNGSLRVLATAAKKRLSLLPDVPTTAEAGLPGFEVDSWGGLVAPIGTPTTIIQQLNSAIQGALAEKELRDVLIEAHSFTTGVVLERLLDLAPSHALGFAIALQTSHRVLELLLASAMVGLALLDLLTQRGDVAQVGMQRLQLVRK